MPVNLYWGAALFLMTCPITDASFVQQTSIRAAINSTIDSYLMVLELVFYARLVMNGFQL